MGIITFRTAIKKKFENPLVELTRYSKLPSKIMSYTCIKNLKAEELPPL